MFVIAALHILHMFGSLFVHILINKVACNMQETRRVL